MCETVIATSKVNRATTLDCVLKHTPRSRRECDGVPLTLSLSLSLALTLTLTLNAGGNLTVYGHDFGMWDTGVKVPPPPTVPQGPRLMESCAVRYSSRFKNNYSAEI